MIWPNELLVAQQEVARYAPEYYRQMYRQQEVFYWAHIPKWMHSDWKTGEPKAVLDVGCAYGTLLLYCKLATGCHAVGIDRVDAGYSKELFSRYGMSFEVCDVELDAVPLPPTGKYDAVIATEVIEHFRFHPLPTLKKLNEAMNPGGVLYVSTPDAATWGRLLTYYGTLDAIPQPDETLRYDLHQWDHVWQYTEGEIRRVIEEAGFRINRFAQGPGVGGTHFNLSAVKVI